MELILKQRAFIDSLREKFDLTYTEIARKSKVAHTTITRLFSDGVKNPLNSTTLNKIAQTFNVEPFKFQVGRVPLVGYIGAGGEVILFSDSQMQDLIEAPQEAVEEGAEALIVRGDSMWPVYKNNEVLYYVKQCDYDPSFLGRDCIVELVNGQRLVKILKRGTLPGTFTLDSYNQPPMEDIKISWACPVKWTKKY